MSFTSFNSGLYLFLNTLLSNTLSSCSSPNLIGQVSHPYKTTGNDTQLCTFIPSFSYTADWRHSGQNCSRHSMNWINSTFLQARNFTFTFAVLKYSQRAAFQNFHWLASSSDSLLQVTTQICCVDKRRNSRCECATGCSGRLCIMTLDQLCRPLQFRSIGTAQELTWRETLRNKVGVLSSTRGSSNPLTDNICWLIHFISTSILIFSENLHIL